MSYISASAIPASPLAPATWAVYDPPARYCSMAESRLDGSVQAKAPAADAAEAICALPPQPSLVTVIWPGMLSCNSGSGSRLPTPNCSSAGPEARINKGIDPDVPWPPVTNPTMSCFAPVPTCARQEILIRRLGVASPATVSVAAMLVVSPTLFHTRHV